VVPARRIDSVVTSEYNHGRQRQLSYVGGMSLSGDSFLLRPKIRCAPKAVAWMDAFLDVLGLNVISWARYH
jgi:hypothetical protein